MQSWDCISVIRQNILNPTQEIFFYFLDRKKWLHIFQKIYIQKNIILLLSSSTQYHKTWVSCDMRITTMSRQVWECYLWKGLSDLQPDFEVPGPEIPVRTPADIKQLGIPKKWVRTTSCVSWTSFLLAVPSPGTPAIGLCVSLHSEIIVQDRKNTWPLASSYSGTAFLVLWVCFVSHLYLFAIMYKPAPMAWED